MDFGHHSLVSEDHYWPDLSHFWYLDFFEESMTQFYIVRGIPGSGKSTVARTIADAISGYHFEADMYFEQDGEYKFDMTKLHQAHQWCQNQVSSCLYYGTNVVVSNTFTTIKELKPYFELAKQYAIVPNVVLAQNQFQNVHNVPEDKLQIMRDRFVYDLTPLFNYLKD